jgi:hypothetical protein
MLAEYLAALLSAMCSTVLTRTGTAGVAGSDDLLQPQVAAIKNPSAILNLLFINF